MTLTERIHAASWWSQWEYPIGLSSPDVLESIGDRAEIVCIMRQIVTEARDAERPVKHFKHVNAYLALDDFRPWDRQSFDEAAEAVLEVCP
jgi:hypothetical protein